MGEGGGYRLVLVLGLLISRLPLRLLLLRLVVPVLPLPPARAAVVGAVCPSQARVEGRSAGGVAIAHEGRSGACGVASHPRRRARTRGYKPPSK